jgi:hypothetical protein
VNDRTLLIAQIETAFANVTKGNACGLRESDANDAGADPEPARALDVEERWQDLTNDLLEQYPCALIFTNWEGFRFLLPAYMRYALNHQGEDETAADHAMYQLGSNRDSPDKIAARGFRFEEIKVIAAFVRYNFNENNNGFELKHVLHWESLAAHI